MFLQICKWVLIVLSIVGPIGVLMEIGRIDMSILEGLGFLWGFYGLLKILDKLQHGGDVEFSFKGWTLKFFKKKRNNKKNRGLIIN